MDLSNTAITSRRNCARERAGSGASRRALMDTSARRCPGLPSSRRATWRRWIVSSFTGGRGGPARVGARRAGVGGFESAAFLCRGRCGGARGVGAPGEIIRLTMTMRGGDRPKHAHEEFAEVSVMPRSMWEPWLIFRKPLEGRAQDNLRKWRTGGFRRPLSEQPFGDVIASSPTRAGERAIAPHPSLKPQAFMRQIVRAVLPLGEGVVLDPFAGARVDARRGRGASAMKASASSVMRCISESHAKRSRGLQRLRV